MWDIGVLKKHEIGDDRAMQRSMQRILGAKRGGQLANCTRRPPRPVSRPTHSPTEDIAGVTSSGLCGGMWW